MNSNNIIINELSAFSDSGAKGINMPKIINVINITKEVINIAETYLMVSFIVIFLICIVMLLIIYISAMETAFVKKIKRYFYYISTNMY